MLTAARGCIIDADARMKLRAITFNNLGCFYKVGPQLFCANHSAVSYSAAILVGSKIGSNAICSPSFLIDGPMYR